MFSKLSVLDTFYEKLKNATFEFCACGQKKCPFGTFSKPFCPAAKPYKSRVYEVFGQKDKNIFY